jgi:GNAT superfamily N-acetyltransferase
MIEPLSPPEPLSDDHQTDTFDSSEPVLDDWLRRRARANQVSGASRTYVVCQGKRVVAYYALASGAIAQAGVPGKFRRNMPDPIPAVVLARLAVDRGYQGGGLGRALFRDAAHRVAHAADTIGIRGIVVHAISEEARKFYIALGFRSVSC